MEMNSSRAGAYGAVARSALRIVLCACAFSIAVIADSSAQTATPSSTKSSPQAEACYAGYGLPPQEKIRICTDVIEQTRPADSSVALAYFSRAVASSNLGDQKGAQADYKEALKLFTDAIRASPGNAAMLFQRGLIYHTMGETDQAIVDYSDAIRLAPTDDYAYVNRGIALYSRQDNNEGALRDFDAAIKLNRCEVNAWINRGIVYKRKGNLDQAVSDFTTAIGCLPPDPPPVRLASETPTGAALNTVYFRQAQAAAELSDAYYQRGLAYLSKVDKNTKSPKQALDMAIADFTTAIRFNPTAAAPLVGRASAYLQKEQFRPAIADFTEALRLGPGDESTYLNRGIAYHSVNEADSAIADYSEAHRINPTDVIPLINRGIASYSLKAKCAPAIEDFTEALKIDPKEVNALTNRGICWNEKGEPDKAIADFSEALRLGLQTGDVLTFGSKDPEAVRYWAQVARARYLRGLAYAAKGEQDLALADFNESIRLNPSEARTFVARGGIYLLRQAYKRAIADFDEGLRLDPAYAFGYFQRGFVYHSLNEPDKAYADYSKSIALDPKYITAYLDRGILEYARRGDFAGAIADFTTALKLSPDNVDALLHRGVAYGANGDFDKSFADLDRAIDLSPGSAKAYYYRGVLDTMRSDTERAVADFGNAIRLDAKGADAYLGRAGVYAQLGQHDKAIADLDQAIALAPTASVAYYNRGFSYFATGQYAKAIADYNEAIRLNPDLAVAYSNRCLTRAVLGKDLADAVGDCDRALKLQPANLDARDTRAFIYLKLSDYPKAIADYGLSLQADPNRARALYGRGLAKAKSGDKAGGEADMAAAAKRAPGIARDFTRFGVTIN